MVFSAGLMTINRCKNFTATKNGRKQVAFFYDQGLATEVANDLIRKGERVRLAETALRPTLVENECAAYYYARPVFCVVFGPAVRNPVDCYFPATTRF